MKRSTVLILEDDSGRIERFQIVLQSVDEALDVRTWASAHMMLQDIESLFCDACLISLDHDLNPLAPGAPDPGDGYLVAEWLASQRPVCPVIVHSTNVERSTLMAYRLYQSGWNVHRVGPIGDDWIETSWRTCASELVER